MTAAPTGPTERCPLTPLGMPRCDRPAFYEMDIDGNEKWIPLCIEHGPMYRASSNVRIRTRRTAAPTCVHCGYFVQYEIPKAPAEPGWVHLPTRPDRPTRPGPCDTPEPEDVSE